MENLKWYHTKRPITLTSDYIKGILFHNQIVLWMITTAWVSLNVITMVRNMLDLQMFKTSESFYLLFFTCDLIGCHCIAVTQMKHKMWSNKAGILFQLHSLQPPAPPLYPSRVALNTSDRQLDRQTLLSWRNAPPQPFQILFPFDPLLLLWGEDYSSVSTLIEMQTDHQVIDMKNWLDSQTSVETKPNINNH